MKPRDILRAMGHIDESLIDEALETNGNLTKKAVKKTVGNKQAEGVYAESIIEVKEPPKSRRNIFKWAGAAACLCAAVVGVVFLSRSQLITNLTPSFSPDTSDSSDSGGADIVIDTEKTEASFETEITNEVSYSVSSDDNKLPPDAVLNVPFAKLKELPIKEEGYISCSEKYLSFIADNRSYFSTVSPTDTDNVYLVQLISYDFETEEETVIFSERRKANGEQELAYTPLCVYDGYIYLRREENYDFRLMSEYWQDYSRLAGYSIWRIGINHGLLENISDMWLELEENICDTPVLDRYMYYESVVKLEEEGCVYNINRIDLKVGYAEVFMENARCPLVYDNKIAFYREGAFYQCEKGGFQTLLIKKTVDFSKDRLASDENNIFILAHSGYEESFAFTAELYNKSEGLKPIAVFNENTIESEEFKTMESAPKITEAGGRFEFMNIIFDPVENAFFSAALNSTDSENKTGGCDIIKWDDRFLYAAYDLTLDETELHLRNILIYEF